MKQVQGAEGTHLRSISSIGVGRCDEMKGFLEEVIPQLGFEGCVQVCQPIGGELGGGGHPQEMKQPEQRYGSVTLSCVLRTQCWGLLP